VKCARRANRFLALARMFTDLIIGCTGSFPKYSSVSAAGRILGGDKFLR
jgi:hypothetical protein